MVEVVGSGERIEEMTCPYCRSNKIIHDREKGEVTCQKCGSVISEREIDYGPEWRSFTQEDRERRERARPINTSMSGMGIGTKISPGLTSSPKLKILLKRQKRVSMMRDFVERNIIQIQEVLRPLKTSLGIQDDVVIQDVILMYRFLAKRGVKFTRIKELATALLYIACKRYKTSCRLKELVKESDVSRRRFTRTLNKIKQILKQVSISIPGDEEISKFIMRVLTKLMIRDSDKMTITRMVMEIVRNSKLIHLTNGRSIHSLAASAIYIVTTLLNMKKKQKDIAIASDTTDVTIRNRYRETLNKINIEVYV